MLYVLGPVALRAKPHQTGYVSLLLFRRGVEEC